jgi:hypothetical protein
MRLRREPEIIVRSRRSVNGGVRPLKLDVRSPPLTSVVNRLRAVAFSYALIGVTFFAFAAMLVIFTWSGSVGRLWHDLRKDSDHSVPLFSGIALGHWVLAGLSLRYLNLDRLWRGVTIAGSLFLALWNIGGAMRLTIAGAPEALSFIPAPEVISVKWLLALAYSICAYSLLRHWGASNHRWSGP